MKAEQIFKKILFATDGSEGARLAQNLTAFLAKRLNSQVTVVHVVSHEIMSYEGQKARMDRTEFVPIGPTGAGTFPVEERVPQATDTAQEEVSRELNSWFHEKGKEMVNDSANFFNGEGIPIDQKIVQHIDPAEAIIKEAHEGKYDLIAIGASGEEEEEPHLGSVAEKVSRHAKISVLIAREKGQMGKMLIPVDGSENSQKALEYAVEIARKTGANITLLYAQEPSIFRLRPELSAQIGSRILAKAEQYAEGVKTEQKLELGDPGKAITKMANKEGFDIIVMGIKGRSTVERFLLGSVSDHVIHYANRPVLLIR